MKRTEYPLYKIPVYRPSIIDNVESGLKEVSENKLFDLWNDYDKNNNLYDEQTDITKHMLQLMIQAMKEMDAPQEQFIRLALK